MEESHREKSQLLEALNKVEADLRHMTSSYNKVCSENQSLKQELQRYSEKSMGWPDKHKSRLRMVLEPSGTKCDSRHPEDMNCEKEPGEIDVRRDRDITVD